MPFYFAYGANMDISGMRQRCPRSIPLGPARLTGYAFFVMSTGYASIRHKAGGIVHGLAWNLHPRDVAVLDDFEEVETGLYRKRLLPVQFGKTVRSALVYVGSSSSPGEPARGYMEIVLAAAVRLRLPPNHLQDLRRWRRSRQPRPFQT